jgi:glycosyltransferase involved in cell wall biosynthesis
VTTHEPRHGTARLVWLGVARSPYNDYLFARLAERYALTVVLQQRSVSTHPWRLGGASFPVLHVREDRRAVLRAVREADATVMSGWNDPAYLALMPLLRRPRAFWTDTPDTRWRRGALREVARRALVRAVFAHFDEVWSTGRPGRETLEAMGASPSKTRELPFFLDLDRLGAIDEAGRAEAAAFRQQHAATGSVVFVGAGQLATKKRYADAIDAVAEVPGAVLWLCGTGPEEESLRARARARGVVDRVVFHGWVQPDTMALAYQAADVFVHPAARDPFPTVVLDAMTWGKPVIGSDVSGSVLDRVTDGVEGFVTPEGDVAAIARAMRVFVDDRARVVSMGAASRAKAERYPVSLAFDRVDALLARGPRARR